MKPPNPPTIKKITPPPRIPPAILEKRALERWEGEGGASPDDGTARREARCKKTTPGMSQVRGRRGEERARLET